MRPGPDNKIGPFVTGTRVSASWLNWMLTQCKKFCNLTVMPPLSLIDSPEGPKLVLNADLCPHSGTVVKFDTTNMCLIVQPDVHSYTAATGLLTFNPWSIWESENQKPDDPPTGEDQPFIRVYVDGIPPEIAEVFFEPGQTITYFAYNQTGSYITVVDRIEFVAEITPPSSPTQHGVFSYTWKACKRQMTPVGTIPPTDVGLPYATYSVYTLPGVGGNWTGTAYNMWELTNKLDGSTVSPMGLVIASDGTVDGTTCSLKPLGKHFARVWRVWNGSSGYQYFFTSPNSSGT